MSYDGAALSGQSSGGMAGGMGGMGVDERHDGGRLGARARTPRGVSPRLRPRRRRRPRHGALRFNGRQAGRLAGPGSREASRRQGEGPPGRRQDVLLQGRTAGSTRPSSPRRTPRPRSSASSATSSSAWPASQSAERNQYLTFAEPVTLGWRRGSIGSTRPRASRERRRRRATVDGDRTVQGTGRVPRSSFLQGVDRDDLGRITLSPAWNPAEPAGDRLVPLGLLGRHGASTARWRRGSNRRPRRGTARRPGGRGCLRSRADRLEQCLGAAAARSASSVGWASTILPMSSWSWIRSTKIGRRTFRSRSCLYSWSSAWSRSTIFSRVASARISRSKRAWRPPSRWSSRLSSAGDRLEDSGALIGDDGRLARPEPAAASGTAPGRILEMLGLLLDRVGVRSRRLVSRRDVGRPGSSITGAARSRCRRRKDPRTARGSRRLDDRSRSSPCFSTDLLVSLTGGPPRLASAARAGLLVFGSHQVTLTGPGKSQALRVRQRPIRSPDVTPPWRYHRCAE